MTDANTSPEKLAITRAQPTEITVAGSSSIEPFDRPVILQQSPWWSRAVVWGIILTTASLTAWACLAKIEEAVPAQGQLEPQGAVKEVQSPVQGVVKEVFVQDGQQVKQGDLLLSLDPRTAKAQLSSLQQIRANLVQENQFYRSQLNQPGSVMETEIALASVKVHPEVAMLTKSRAALIAENQLFRAELSGQSRSGRLSAGQQERLLSSQAEFDSRTATARLDREQIERQLSQAEIQLANAKSTLAINQRILNDIEPLMKEGGIARVQFLRQQQEVQERQADVDRFGQEAARLKLAIAQAQEKLDNTIAQSQKDLLTRMADNEKQIATIDSQLTKAIVENEKRINEIDAQLSQASVTLQYQELRAPANGTVFDLKAKSSGFVANTTEPLLKIVPADSLVSKVFITNKDIGFVHEGMTADVRIDSFPFSEFGDVKGKLIWIGSDALPPDQIHPFYRFPAKVQLDRQTLLVNGREIVLQSGMSVTVNIKVRSRSVISLFTDLFSRKVESLKFVR